MNRVYENAWNNSNSKKVPEIHIRTNKKKLTKLVAIYSAVVILATSAVNYGLSELKQTVTVNNITQPYVEMIQKNTHHIPATNNEMRDYGAIADKIIQYANENNNGNPDLTDYQMEIYKTYIAMKHTSARMERSGMNDVMRILSVEMKDSDINLPDNFSDYIIQLGYVDDNKPDYDAYEDGEADLLYLQNQVNNMIKKRNKERI